LQTRFGLHVTLFMHAVMLALYFMHWGKGFMNMNRMHVGVGITLGLCFGAALGASLQNLGVGIALGVSLGAIYGAAFGPASEAEALKAEARKKAAVDKPLPRPLGL
jgi:hypothetical protein